MHLCPPSSPHMASFVRIALADAGSFAIMGIVEGDTIGHLAERACVKFSHWGMNAAQISLYLVAAGGDDLPTPSAVDSARHLDQIGWSLSRAGVSSGAWLVARKNFYGGASFSCLARVCPITHTASLRLDLHRPPTLTFLPQSRRALAVPSAQTLFAVSLLH